MRSLIQKALARLRRAATTALKYAEKEVVGLRDDLSSLTTDELKSVWTSAGVSLVTSSVVGGFFALATASSVLNGIIIIISGSAYIAVIGLKFIAKGKKG